MLSAAGPGQGRKCHHEQVNRLVRVNISTGRQPHRLRETAELGAQGTAPEGRT